ncbi:MAG: hypothetical protein V9G12_24975 [Microthrixaceae bacterium]
MNVNCRVVIDETSIAAITGQQPGGGGNTVGVNSGTTSWAAVVDDERADGQVAQPLVAGVGERCDEGDAGR